MFISHNNGRNTATVHVDTGGDMVSAIGMMVVGVCTISSVIHHPIRHWIAVLVGLGLVLAGWRIAANTIRLIRRARTAYREGLRL